ncbi:MAG: thioredoxin fold domain-containing protein [Paludibacteraceae bacterium]|nr:thioredoxin fold domain-containing protein [Paludibacteraceae bacterium]
MYAEDVIYLTTEQFRERVYDYKNERDWKYLGDKPCVIDFYTTWCGPCKRLAPIMEELSQTYCGEVVFYKADTERERELAYLFGINSIPQVLYVPMEGKPMLLKGLYPKENIVQIINDFLLTKVQKEPEQQTVQEPVAPPAQPEKKKSWWERWKEKRRKNK